VTTDPLVAEVVSVDGLSPHLVRVVVTAPGFTSLDVPDEAVVVTFPRAGSNTAAVEDSRDGHWYTVRHVGAGDRLTLDIATHEGGIGSAWTGRARVGDRLHLRSQGSWYRRGADARWQVLLVDVTGLPACARILEQTPRDVRSIAVVEVPDAADRQHLPGAEVTWLPNPALTSGASLLGRAARSVTVPDGPGYVYAAGEAAATREVRRHLRHELGLPATAYGVIGYWRRDAHAWARRIAESGVDLDALWDEAESLAPDDEEAAIDAYEERLDRAGLLG
jgi:NADPH-dependent ferric siderophore reductase